MFIQRLFTSCPAPAAVAAAIAMTAGCTFNWMPVVPPTPRSLILQDLRVRCLASKDEQLPKLLEPGVEPHRKLRFAVDKDVQATWRLLAPPKFADAPLQLTTEFEGIGPAGVSCHRYTLLGGLDPEDDPDDPIKGVIGVSRLGSIGIWTDGLDPTSQRMEMQLGARLAWIEPRLPVEPVGVGGMWQLHDEGFAGEDRVEVDTVFRLLDKRGSRLTLLAMRSSSRALSDDGKSRRDSGPSAASAKPVTTRRVAIIDVDLRHRFIPSARVFDDQGREVERMLPAFR